MTIRLALNACGQAVSEGGGGGNMTVPTDRHETCGPSQDYGMSRDQRRAIYSSLTLDSLYSLVLDSQLYSISVSGL
jgi:hypothetical protein